MFQIAIKHCCPYKTLDKSGERDIKPRIFHCKIEEEEIVLFKDIIITLVCQFFIFF